MFTPQNFAVALFMMVMSAICWGSWANTYKGVKNYRFELFYWDYAVGIFVTALVLAFTLGSTAHDSSSFLANVHSTDTMNFWYALAGGAVFNIANLLLVAGIDMAGLAVAFPVAIGIALVVGVVTTYIRNPEGSPLFLSLGVLSALVAVVLDGKAYSDLGATGRTISRKSIVVCVVSGILMGLWAPFMSDAMHKGNFLGPYSAGVFFTLGALLSCLVFNVYFMKKPLVGNPVGFSGFFQASSGAHMLGLLGGAIWSLGTVSNFVASSFKGVGLAISYAIGQSAPMVAALWGVFVWKEFTGANARAKTYLALMFLFYLLAIVLVAHASQAG